MDASSAVTIIVAVVVVYLIFKFIVSPLIKLIAGIVIFLIAIYILQTYFNFSFNQYLGPFSKYIDIDKTIDSASWIINPIIAYVNKAISFLKLLLSNAPKQ